MTRMQDTEEQLEKTVEYSLLFDFYGALLSENNRQIFEEYILNDLSLSEVAAEHGISRQGVHDVVKRSSKKLQEYELKLGLVAKFKKAKENIRQIHIVVSEMKTNSDMRQLDRIEQLTAEILEQM